MFRLIVGLAVTVTATVVVSTVAHADDAAVLPVPPVSAQPASTAAPVDAAVVLFPAEIGPIVIPADGDVR